MERQEITTKKQYKETLLWIDKMFDIKLKPNTKEAEQLEIALLAVKKYEDANYSIPSLLKH
ncbi:MAG: hypothetical protein LH615_02410 [Ferruginibacter sp.]|nr:hypothetical protein [Ferruginibacter sp.]